MLTGLFKLIALAILMGSLSPAVAGCNIPAPMAAGFANQGGELSLRLLLFGQFLRAFRAERPLRLLQWRRELPQRLLQQWQQLRRQCQQRLSRLLQQRRQLPERLLQLGEQLRR
jgi:hypothetical protein